MVWGLHETISQRKCSTLYNYCEENVQVLANCMSMHASYAICSDTCSHFLRDIWEQYFQKEMLEKSPTLPALALFCCLAVYMLFRIALFWSLFRIFALSLGTRRCGALSQC